MGLNSFSFKCQIGTRVARKRERFQPIELEIEQGSEEIVKAHKDWVRKFVKIARKTLKSCGFMLFFLQMSNLD